MVNHKVHPIRSCTEVFMLQYTKFLTDIPEAQVVDTSFQSLPVLTCYGRSLLQQTLLKLKEFK